MGHESPPQFRTFHALRVKGFATTPAIVQLAAVDPGAAEDELAARLDRGHAKFREQRALWQMTAEGRTAHQAELLDDLADVSLDPLEQAYDSFLAHNVEFKELCGTWQVRNGVPNDHQDREYDRAAIADLGRLHERVVPVLDAMEGVLVRLAPYAPRLTGALDRLTGGDVASFTGVMCGSYHDVWMELHEDLLLTMRRDRATEGSF